MIRHQIKTIEQAADLYRELIDEPDSVAIGRVEASDYQISFFVEIPALLDIEIKAEWGEKTELGNTVITTSFVAHAVKPKEHITVYNFRCNRENILEMARKAAQGESMA